METLVIGFALALPPFIGMILGAAIGKSDNWAWGCAFAVGFLEWAILTFY